MKPETMDNVMNKKDTYQNLREEIMYKIKQQDLCITAAYTISVSLWTIAMNISNCWIALIPIVALIPLSLRFCDNRYSIAFLSVYMGVFIECESIYGWESARERYYLKFKRKLSDKFIYLFSKFNFTILSIVSILIFWYLRGFIIKIHNNIFLGIMTLMIQIIIVIFNIVITNKYSDISKLKNNILHNWQEIYAEYNTCDKDEKL